MDLGETPENAQEEASSKGIRKKRTRVHWRLHRKQRKILAQVIVAAVLGLVMLLIWHYAAR